MNFLLSSCCTSLSIINILEKINTILKYVYLFLPIFLSLLAAVKLMFFYDKDSR